MKSHKHRHVITPMVITHSGWWVNVLTLSMICTIGVKVQVKTNVVHIQQWILLLRLEYQTFLNCSAKTNIFLPHTFGVAQCCKSQSPPTTFSLELKGIVKYRQFYIQNLLHRRFQSFSYSQYKVQRNLDHLVSLGNWNYNVINTRYS